ncbi:tumor necrosis factor ligand superfamily member 14 isoform X2 [Salminus brasiliensis]|uniref:tumor necrosis factor ligand superfamily member 14 isoform X2 n=1 Tax=Salminus brasiliensis TaxID=930266 RepID=UPI003B82FD36
MEGDPASGPQVFVVDSQAPVTLQSSGVKHEWGKNRAHVLYLLVGLALLGVVIEAGFIYHLYKPSDTAQASSDNRQNPSPAQQIGTGNRESEDANEIFPVRRKKPDNNKPAAFLQGQNSNERGDGVLQWQTGGLGSFIHGLVYKDGSLQIQTDGFYYIHSKVYFSETCSLFKHQVKWRSPRYNNSPTKLMQGRRFSCVVGVKQGENQADVGNSFLGGVFKLYKNDSVYVQVNNSSLVRAGVYDNFFGVFMI